MFDVKEVENWAHSPIVSESIFESSPDCAKILDFESRLLSMNFHGQCAMEIHDFSVLRGKK